MNLNKFFRISIFCSFTLVCSIGSLAQSEDGKKLIAIEKRRYDAMVHKDTAMLRFLLADSLTFIHSSGVIDNKISFLKDIGSGRITYMFIIPERLTCTIDGDYAWIFGRANVRFKLAV